MFNLLRPQQITLKVYRKFSIININTQIIQLK